MRWSLTAAGLLLLPALTHALPHQPLPEVNDEPAPATSHLPTDTPELEAGAAPGQNVLTLGSPSPAAGTASEGSTLELELSELQTLRAQLARLQKEADARARWLAATAGPAPPLSSSSSPVADCDGPVCVLRAVLRKAGYAAGAVLNHNRDDTILPDPGSQPGLDNQATIPLPPWRGGSNETIDSSLPTLEDDDDTPHHHIPPLLSFLLLLVTLRFALPLLYRLVAGYRGRRLAAIMDEPTVAADGLLPTIMSRREDEEEEEEEEEEERGRRGWRRRRRGGWGCFCGGVSLSAGWGAVGGRGRGGGGVRLGEREDRRRLGGGFVGGEKEGGWDEKRALEEEEERYRDEEEEAAVVEDAEGGGQGGEGEDEEEEEDEEQELLTLGDEIASFRDALALVEDIVAAEEGRSRERQV